MSIADAKKSLDAARLKCDQLARELGIKDTNHTWSKLRMFIHDAICELPPSNAIRDLTEVRATFIAANGGTTVERIHHHVGCALIIGRGECSCDPIRASDFHTPKEAG